MSITSEKLSARVIEFIAVLKTCMSETTFAEDKNLYAGDIASAAAWLARLEAGEQASLIADEIIEPATSKHFTDYWRQGIWGEWQSKALADLQDSISKEHSRTVRS
jgi:hypothetical protein